ncbi:hypothetical protein FACS189464_1320 [Bacteroidia bacterium]|nr:hypothetical protein FACS189464_1320 [Bacteroidia bacterium]
MSKMIHEQQTDGAVKHRTLTNHDILAKVLKKTESPNFLHLATKLNVRPSLIAEIDEGKKKFTRKLATAITTRFAHLNISAKWLLSGNLAQMGLPHEHISEHKRIIVRKRVPKAAITQEHKVRVIRRRVEKEAAEIEKAALPVLPVPSVQPVKPVKPVKPVVKPVKPVQFPVAVKETVKPVAAPVAKPREERTVEERTAVERTVKELEMPWLSPLLLCQSDLLKSNSMLLSINQSLLNSIIQLAQK